MSKKIVIPAAIEICSDDEGWFNGSDDRYEGRPSRTGMTRKHCAEDYIALNETGKAIGMKIMCPFVIGEWDRWNLLRNETGMTYEPKTWDRASKIDLKEAERCFEAIESSEFIELAHHGVLHGNYAPDGSQITEMEYLTRSSDGKRFVLQQKDEIKRRFDMFYTLYGKWGFTKKIRSFSSPNGLPGYITDSELETLGEVLSEYGIDYWCNTRKKEIDHVEVIKGVLYLEQGVKMRVPWNACDVDPLLLDDVCSEDDATVGNVTNQHWPNFLRFNKEHDLERVESWAEYFRRQSEIFGVMVAKDIAFSGNQAVYRKFGRVTGENGRITIDVSDVVSKTGKYASGAFYLSIKNELVPKETKGGTLELYEKHKNFSTYKITHTQNEIEILCV